MSPAVTAWGRCGAHHLKRVVIDRAQLMQLAEALAVELDVTLGDDVPDRL